MKTRGAKRSALYLAFASLPALAVGLQSAPAQAQAASQNFNIPAQPLENALVEFADQTGVQLIYTADMARGLRSSVVMGSMTPQQAIQRLLAGTGLSARIAPSGAMTIERMSAEGDVAAAEGERVLPSVRVEGATNGSYQSPVRGEGVAALGGERLRQEDEAIGYRARVSSVSTGAPVAIEDVPRSITVQTQELLQKKDITDLVSSFESAPGVTIVDRGNVGVPVLTHSAITIRGQAVESFQIDGGAPRSFNTLGSGNLSLDAFERVELVRGPNSALVGAGSPGGSINLTRKRPSDAPTQMIRIEGGSYNRIGALVDISVPEIGKSNIAFRGVASVRHQDSFVDYNSSKAMTLYGIFDIPLGDDTRVEVGAQYNRARSTGVRSGIPRFGEGDLMPLPRSYSIYGPGVYSDNENREIFANFYAQPLEGLNIEASAFHSENILSNRGVTQSYTFRRNGTIVTPGEVRISSLDDFHSSVLGVSGKISGTFETFGLRHDVFVMGAATHTNNGPDYIEQQIAFAPVNTLADLQDLQYESLPTFGDLFFNIYGRRRDTNTSIAVGDTISWKDRIFLTANFRRDNNMQESATAQRSVDGGISETGNIAIVRNSGTWRPSYSVVVKPIDQLSLFGSYADGFFRQDNLFARSGDSFSELAPARYKNQEIGAKWASRSWNASLSAYRLNLEGLASTDGADNSCPPNQTAGGVFTSPCYVLGGATQKSKGIDAEISGQILPGLSVVANYNYGKTKTVATDIPLVTLAPQSSASVFIDWTPSFADDFSIQLAGRYKSRYYSRGTQRVYNPVTGAVIQRIPFEFAQDPYVVIDLGIDYRVSDELTARLYIENLFDKVYLKSLSPSTVGGNYYGTPRTFLANLTYKRRGQSRGNAGLELVPFGSSRNWYGAIDAGLSVPSSLKAVAAGRAQNGVDDVRWSFNAKNGTAVSARFGYYVGPQLRTEFEGLYRASRFAKIGGSDVAPFGLCDATNSFGAGAPFDCSRTPGSLRDWGASLNLVYDFAPRDSAFVPYAGLGIGVTKTTYAFSGKMDGIGGTTPWEFDFTRVVLEQLGATGSTTNLSYQAQVGVSAKITDRLRLDLTAKHSLTPSVKYNSYNQGTDYFGIPQLTPRLGEFKGDAHSTSALVGIRWSFGSSGQR